MKFTFYLRARNTKGVKGRIAVACLLKLIQVAAPQLFINVLYILNTCT